MVPLKVVLLAAVFGSANTVAAREIGLILHYSFDEGAIQDHSGYSNDGEAIGDFDDFDRPNTVCTGRYLVL